MRKAENVNAPWLGGWIIGAAAGLVAFAVLVIVGKFDLFPAGAIGAAVAFLVGLILGMPWSAGDQSVLDHSAAVAVDAKTKVEAASVEVPRADVAPVAAAAMAAPVLVMSEPVAEPVVAPKPKAAKTPAAKSKAAAPKAAAPKVAKPKVAKAKPEGPERLSGPRKGKADDLKEIEGIGPAMEKLVNGLGFYHFDQIASWSDADVTWVDANMTNFKGRIVRDKWVAQAKIIVTEGLESFRERAKTNNY
jgi:predicted flap endonuclease-1-like 5' DNA nuclease